MILIFYVCSVPCSCLILSKTFLRGQPFFQCTWAGVLKQEHYGTFGGSCSGGCCSSSSERVYKRLLCPTAPSYLQILFSLKSQTRKLRDSSFYLVLFLNGEYPPRFLPDFRILGIGSAFGFVVFYFFVLSRTFSEKEMEAQSSKE